MKNTIWISFDLGVNGDYEGIYAWLDNHTAKECGDSMAFLEYTWNTDIASELKNELIKNVKITSRTRIYMIYNNREGATGVWLVGSRKQAPWTGFGNLNNEESSSDDSPSSTS